MEVFNIVFTWAKDYVKYKGHDVESVYIFLSGSSETSKSNLVKVTYNAILKALVYHCKDSEKPIALLLRPTWISAVNIVGTTIHSGLGIKSGTNLLGLNGKSKAALRNGLSGAKFVIINTLSMVSSDLWRDIDSTRLEEMFMMIPKIAFASLLVITVTDLFQIPLVREKLVFSQFSDKDSMKHLFRLAVMPFV